MRTPIILILLVFWCWLAIRAFELGDTTAAIIYALVGAALTAYRFGLGRR
jgi:hypothetical protein